MICRFVCSLSFSLAIILVPHAEELADHPSEVRLASYLEAPCGHLRMLRILGEPEEEPAKGAGVRPRVAEPLSLMVLIELYVKPPMAHLDVPVAELSAEEVVGVDVAEVGDEVAHGRRLLACLLHDDVLPHHGGPSYRHEGVVWLEIIHEESCVLDHGEGYDLASPVFVPGEAAFRQGIELPLQRKPLLLGLYRLQERLLVLLHMEQVMAVLAEYLLHYRPLRPDRIYRHDGACYVKHVEELGYRRDLVILVADRHPAYVERTAVGHGVEEVRRLLAVGFRR